jgi:hypothetical protein
MSLFSERNGYKAVLDSMTPETVTSQLRNRLWNIIDRAINSDNIDRISFALFNDLYKLPVDTRGEIDHYTATDWNPVIKKIRHHFLNDPWYSVYDHLEVFMRLNFINRSLISKTLSEEQAAYRIVDGHIIPISSETEIAAILEASSNNEGKFASSRQHIHAALSLLAKKPEPDCRNSIKESISAVEATVKAINGVSSDTLGRGLKSMRKREFADSALLEGFEKIYGWSSDKEGIRHALMDSPTLGTAEAKFFLVACSAFSNYLRTLDSE